MTGSCELLRPATWMTLTLSRRRNSLRSSSRTDRCRSTYSAAFDTAPPRFTHSAKNANHVGISRYTTVIAFGPYVKGKDTDKDQASKNKDKDKGQVSKTRRRIKPSRTRIRTRTKPSRIRTKPSKSMAKPSRTRTRTRTKFQGQGQRPSLQGQG